MKEECKKIVNELNDNRIKIYYQLNQLEEITGMSARSLKYRMKLVKEKYSGLPNKLHRVGRAWQIHYTIIDEFMPKNRMRKPNLTNSPWESFITWNLKNNYDVKYHIELIKEVQDEFPFCVNIAYVVEQDKRGYNHLHAIADIGKENMEKAVARVLKKYLETTDFRYQVTEINNKASVISYLRKNGVATII